jgi:hypothetical protein
MRMNFSNIESGKKIDPVINSWLNILNKADKSELKNSDTDAKIAAIEEEIKQGALTNLRGMLKEIDNTAWMYESSSYS